MIGEIKEVKIGKKTYEIEKQGVSTALEVNAVWNELVYGDMAKFGADGVNAVQLEKIILSNLKGDVVKDLKNVIINTISNDALDEKKFEELDIQDVIDLFYEIKTFYLDKAEKKN